LHLKIKERRTEHPNAKDLEQTKLSPTFLTKVAWAKKDQTIFYHRFTPQYMGCSELRKTKQQD
jgi:hypothetical protein